MKKIVLMGSVLMALSGCASLPPESVTAQEKIGSGIETARSSQLLLIDSLAEQEKQRIRQGATSIIPQVLAKNFPGKDSYTQSDVEKVMADYSASLESKLKVIDDKHLKLTRDANQFFDDLAAINSLNLELIKSAVEVNKIYKSAFDQLKDKANTKLPEILSQ